MDLNLAPACSGDFAHDKADFDIGLRHKLPVVDIMNPDATMNALAGESLAGLDRFEARKVAVEKLKELGSLTEEKPYENNVGFSERANVPIEPRLSEQWFLKYPSVEKAKACVEHSDEVGRGVPTTPPQTDDSQSHQKMRFHPHRWAKVYDHWLNNIQDWCISRQLWWGHRVPVWRPGKECTGEKRNAAAALIDSREPNNDIFVKYGETMFDIDWPVINKVTGKVENLPPVIAIGSSAQEFAERLEKLGFVQDPDVLDTWFSSWLWPFATMGLAWANANVQEIYPTHGPSHRARHHFLSGSRA